MLLTLLFACVEAVDPNGACTPHDFYLDYDHDGYGGTAETVSECDAPTGFSENADDCDDQVAASYPGAAEVCNSVDDDCDGVVDEDAADGTTFYADADADGYGAASSSVIACAAPAGYAENAEDCDDAAAGVHPDAVETCDEVDQNCDGDVDNEPSDGLTLYADVDLDGFGDLDVATLGCAVSEGWVANSSDCDDANFDVHPGADEHCDGKDEDCDEVTDNSAVDQTIWYFDADGDGVGRSDRTTPGCAAPEDYVAEGTDCDDTDETNTDGYDFWPDADADTYGAGMPTRACTAPADSVPNALDCDDSDADANPAVDEVCGGADENCDGAVDEDDAEGALTTYADADADGYGDATSIAYTCVLATDYSLDGTDCNDADGAVSPGATESCNDTDDNCDGATDEGYDVDEDTFTTCSGDCDDAAADTNPDGTDICDDGIDQDCSGTEETGCYPTGTYTTSDATSTLLGTSALIALGYYGAAGGDLDGDGNDEILVGARSDSSGGAYAGAAWVLEAPLDASSTLADYTLKLYGYTADDRLGSAVGVIGDQDGDGLDEWIVAASGFAASTGEEGASCVVSGATGSAFESPNPDDASAACVVGSSSVSIGLHALAGDLVGSAYDDMVVGNFQSHTLAVVAGPITSRKRLATDATWSLYDAGGYVGGSAAVGDFDGDGADDLLAASYYRDEAWVCYGPLSGGTGQDPSSACDGTVYDTDVNYVALGHRVGNLGDVDGDGLDDMGLGSSLWAATAAASDRPGRWFVVLGAAVPVDGPTSIAWATITGPTGSNFGKAPLTRLGDLDFDGAGDVAFGDHLNQTAYLMVGLTSGENDPTASDLILEGASTGTFGWGLGGGVDMTGDGEDDLLVTDYSSDSAFVDAGAVYLFEL